MPLNEVGSNGRVDVMEALSSTVLTPMPRMRVGTHPCMRPADKARLTWWRLSSSMALIPTA